MLTATDTILSLLVATLSPHADLWTILGSPASQRPLSYPYGSIACFPLASSLREDISSLIASRIAPCLPAHVSSLYRCLQIHLAQPPIRQRRSRPDSHHHSSWRVRNAYSTCTPGCLIIRDPRISNRSAGIANNAHVAHHGAGRNTGQAHGGQSRHPPPSLFRLVQSSRRSQRRTQTSQTFPCCALGCTRKPLLCALIL